MVDKVAVKAKLSQGVVAAKMKHSQFSGGDSVAFKLGTIGTVLASFIALIIL